MFWVEHDYTSDSDNGADGEYKSESGLSMFNNVGSEDDGDIKDNKLLHGERQEQRNWHMTWFIRMLGWLIG
jgi:hypothetical protein